MSASRLTAELSENPVVQVLAAIIAVVVGIRIIFWLLRPIWPYLLIAVVGFAVFRLVHWHRNRW